MKKVIPPVLFILCVLLIVGLNFLLPEQTILKPPFSYVGIILIIAGLAIMSQIKKLFDKVNTEIHTFKKPRQLVKKGLFKFSRNPIYLGFTISLIGVWVLTGNLIGLIGILIFFLISNFWYIPYEERSMEKEFGYEYKLYKSKVRRWI
ncbi:methyltransferase family protein [Flavivirga algicola]|uniref:Isoprenylcysteine carboxylmethyltransferase family protein n=1 Tax=Flavivirga algicola TaxID=2729136 RepID=A0ABX1RX53_9FLAO|nr:isoprenylcysteine carboxylmethyltransferase family protein [Flavivirga algicola]NMH87358.1 isoprenylcysteine carboxylmethyltransferase family protein [Flavivirga algicola]